MQSTEFRKYTLPCLFLAGGIVCKLVSASFSARTLLIALLWLLPELLLLLYAGLFAPKQKCYTLLPIVFFGQALTTALLLFRLYFDTLFGISVSLLTLLLLAGRIVCGAGACARFSRPIYQKAFVCLSVAWALWALCWLGFRAGEFCYALSALQNGETGAQSLALQKGLAIFDPMGDLSLCPGFYLFSKKTVDFSGLF